ncbi:uncharacterized protein METZ01_LOCUS459484, partial [marine metagenome]
TCVDGQIIQARENHCSATCPSGLLRI